MDDFLWLLDDYMPHMVVLVALVVVGGAFGYVVRGAQVDKACTALGWANSRVTWDFAGYCIREENEYEITKPLSELR